MDSSIERIRAKIAELETKLANLRIAESELRALDGASSAPTVVRTGRRGRPPAIRPAAVVEDAETGVETAAPSGKMTIGNAIQTVLGQHGSLAVGGIAEQIQAMGRDINNRAISFTLQALKKRGVVKSANGEWMLKGRTRRA